MLRPIVGGKGDGFARKTVEKEDGRGKELYNGGRKERTGSESAQYVMRTTYLGKYWLERSTLLRETGQIYLCTYDRR